MAACPREVPFLATAQSSVPNGRFKQHMQHNKMLSKAARPVQTSLRTYVTRPSRLASPPTGFEANSSSYPSLPSSSGHQHFTRVHPASPASVYDTLDQIPASQAPLLYSQASTSRSQTALSQEQLKQLQAARARGKSISSLAKEFSVTRSFVMRHGYPSTRAGEASRQEHEALRQQAQKASQAKWGLTKW